MKKTIPYLLVLLIALVALWWWLGKKEDMRQRGEAPEVAGFADSRIAWHFDVAEKTVAVAVPAQD